MSFMIVPDDLRTRRVDSLRRGDKFRAMDGVVYVYVRRDGVLSGVHHVQSDAGKAIFAACATVQV